MKITIKNGFAHIGGLYLGEVVRDDDPNCPLYRLVAGGLLEAHLVTESGGQIVSTSLASLRVRIAEYLKAAQGGGLV